ncbi:hypothetical protein NQZ68_004251 [Dissostichus eleginoides]|nr:hypothetical protein NQZ68_004251 [Dissostichus eleginoides]
MEGNIFTKSKNYYKLYALGRINAPLEEQLRMQLRDGPIFTNNLSGCISRRDSGGGDKACTRMVFELIIQPKERRKYTGRQRKTTVLMCGVRLAAGHSQRSTDSISQKADHRPQQIPTQTTEKPLQLTGLLARIRVQENMAAALSNAAGVENHQTAWSLRVSTEH